MRLYFQIMWFIIILSVVKISTVSCHPSRRLRHRSTLRRRVKRLPGHDSLIVDSRGHYQDDEPRDSNECETPVKTRLKSRRNSAKSHATGIALKAALEAKQANDDMANAVKVASDRIKLEFAEKASSAAKAAEAVLAGKKQVLEQLEMEVREAEIIVQEESQGLTSAENNNHLALKAHRQSQEELKLLFAGLKLAKENAESAELVSTACQQSKIEKASLLEAAQKRVGVLMQQLTEARNDYANTKKAAYKALCAANEARQRINRPSG